MEQRKASSVKNKMPRKRTPPPSYDTVGNIADFYDREGACYKSEKDGRLYIGAKNRKAGIVTIVARIDFTATRNRVVTILKAPQRFAL